MKKSYYIPNPEDVLFISGRFATVVPYHTIRTVDFLDIIRQYIQGYIQRNKGIQEGAAKEITSAWIKEGVMCDLLIPDQKWQKGKVKLALIFEPEEDIEIEAEEPDSPLDDIRQELNQKAEEES